MKNNTRFILYLFIEILKHNFRRFKYRHKTAGTFDLTLLFLYISLHRLNKFLQYLTEAGFRVSRTHFDPTGVRTDATLEQFKSVLTKYSVPTNTNASVPQTSVSMDKTL